MELTKEIIEQHLFEPINKNTWKLGDITLQSGHTIYYRVIGEKKAFNVCWLGKEITITTELELIEVKELNK